MMPPAMRVSSLLLVGALVLVSTSTARSEVGAMGGVGEAASAVFVPAFFGGVTLDAGYETRFPGVLGDETPWATDAISAGLGYLAYVDGHGRTGLGGSLRAAYALDPLLPGRTRFTRLDLRLESRWRFQNARFAHGAVSTAVEIGALLPADDSDPVLRWAVMLGTGPGLLFNSHPFLFGEGIIHLGLESLQHPTGTAYAIIAGLRLRIDYAIRGREVRPCEYAPMEFGECP